jgi:hypothetical protein
MLAIQNAMRRFLIFANLNVVKHALLRMCRKPAVQVITPKSVIEPAIEPAMEVTPNTEVEDTEDRFAAWEDDRDEKLHQAEVFEEQGLRLLAKATLLRVAIRCDDRGEVFIAEELREHAQTLDNETVAALSREERWAPTIPFNTNAASTPPGV